MADEHGRWIVRETTDVIATATEHGLHRSTGEQLPLHERVQLQRRKITVLRAISNRSPSARGVQQAAREAEAQLTDMLAAVPGSRTTTLDVKARSL